MIQQVEQEVKAKQSQNQHQPEEKFFRKQQEHQMNEKLLHLENLIQRASLSHNSASHQPDNSMIDKNFMQQMMMM